MQIEIAGQIICHGPDRVLGNAIGPLGQLGIAGQYAQQIRRALRGENARPANRKGHLATITINVEREFATAAAAESWLLNHLLNMPAEGTLKFTFDGGTHLFCKDAALGTYTANQIGVTIRLTYNYAVGEYSTQ